MMLVLYLVLSIVGFVVLCSIVFNMWVIGLSLLIVLVRFGELRLKVSLVFFLIMVKNWVMVLV